MSDSALSSAWRSILESAFSDATLTSAEQFAEWWASQHEIHRTRVERIPLADLQGWHLHPLTGNLYHHTGGFFEVEGVEVDTNFGPKSHWCQPLLNQPEIGILGFVTQRMGGLLHFLIQAKFEPGNVNAVQLAPTVQATRSNYSLLHGGRRPPYLDYFLTPGRATILVDELLSEHGARFLLKRNRNIIVELPPEEHLEILPGFCWVTLRQLHELLRRDNVLNMASRTVLSCVGVPPAPLSPPERTLRDSGLTDFQRRVIRSKNEPGARGESSLEELLAWLGDLRRRLQMEVRTIPLRSTTDWIADGTSVRHRQGRFFEIFGVSVSAADREVTSWCQPIVSSTKGGVLCWLCQQRGGVLHVLVQGRLEPGNFTTLELAPTLQITPDNYDLDCSECLPPFTDLLLRAEEPSIRHRSKQSEEGGRFFHDVNEYRIVEIDEGQDLELPYNYRWMTLCQVHQMAMLKNHLSISARTLAICIGH